jgi:hypothetical protein
MGVAAELRPHPCLPCHPAMGPAPPHPAPAPAPAPAPTPPHPSLIMPHGGMWRWLGQMLATGCTSARHAATQRYRAMITYPASIRYGREPGLVLLIILIGIAYSVVAPLMAPFALAYMATSWLLWRYQVGWGARWGGLRRRGARRGAFWTLRARVQPRRRHASRALPQPLRANPSHPHTAPTPASSTPPLRTATRRSCTFACAATSPAAACGRSTRAPSTGASPRS